MNAKFRVEAAAQLGLRYAIYEGVHHKQWVIDQMLRLLLEDEYHERVAQQAPSGWDTGVAP